MGRGRVVLVILVILGCLPFELSSSDLGTLKSLFCLGDEVSLGGKLGLTSKTREELSERVSGSKRTGKLAELKVWCEGNIEGRGIETRATPSTTLSVFSHVCASCHSWKSCILNEAIKVHSAHKTSVCMAARVASLFRCFHRIAHAQTQEGRKEKDSHLVVFDPSLQIVSQCSVQLMS